MNLLTDPWLPVRTSGGRGMVKPSEIANPAALALDFPRPDFNGAVAEFLIGLLSTMCAPQNENEWRRLWYERPTSEALQAAFEPAVEAFEFGRFMQADIDGERTNIEQLIPDSEGEITARQSVDLMNRVGQIAALSPAMAAAALITLQSHAPEGGSAPNDHSGKREGYYASIRGGGPLTTLVRAGTDLWGLIWPNVETREQLEARAVGPISSAALAAFPWMRGGLEDITPDNGHPCTVYWTTPRKVKLIVEPANGVMCDLTGEAGGQIVRHYVRASGGRRFVVGSTR